MEKSLYETLSIKGSSVDYVNNFQRFSTHNL